MKFRDWDRNLKIRLIGEFCVGSIFWMSFPFLVMYFKDELGTHLTGILMIISQLLGVVANFLGGYFADHFGRKKMMVFSAIAQAIVMVLFALTTSPWLTSPILGFICFSLIGIFGTLYNPASQAMVADVVSEEQRVNVYATFYTVNNIAVVFGPIIGSFFFATHRFQLYLTSALVMGLLAVLLHKYLKETSPTLLNDSTKEQVSGSWIQVIVNQAKSYYIILTDKVFFIFIVAGVLLSVAYMQIELLMPLFADELVKEHVQLQLPTFTLFNYTTPSEISLSAENIYGFLVGENGFMVITCTLLLTALVKRMSERNVFVISSILYSISMIYLGYTAHFTGLYVAMFIFTIAEIMTAGIQMGFIARIAPDHLRGKYFAASGLRWTLGRTIAPLAINIAALFGFKLAFISVAIMAFISAIMYFYMYHIEAIRESMTKEELKIKDASN